MCTNKNVSNRSKNQKRSRTLKWATVRLIHSKRGYFIMTLIFVSDGILDFKTFTLFFISGEFQNKCSFKWISYINWTIELGASTKCIQIHLWWISSNTCQLQMSSVHWTFVNWWQSIQRYIYISVIYGYFLNT